MKIKVFNFLCRIATDCNFFKKKLQYFLIMKIQYLFWCIKYFRRDKFECFGSFNVCKRSLLFLKITVFREKKSVFTSGNVNMVVI